MKDPNPDRIGKAGRFPLSDRRRGSLPRPVGLTAGESDGPDPEALRVRQHLHRFFEELLRRSEH